jgi:hypothetical protein
MPRPKYDYVTKEELEKMSKEHRCIESIYRAAAVRSDRERKRLEEIENKRKNNNGN